MATPNETILYKPVNTTHDVLDVIKNRWSPRAFDTRPIEREKLLRLFEAARWTASSMNTQPWRFIMAARTDRAAFDKMLGILKDGNRVWAQNAPLLMLAIAQRQHENGRDNRHAQHDVGQALAQLTLQATADDLMVHQMGGFFPDQARDVYQIPDAYDPLTAIAIGYQGALDTLSDDLQAREQHERQRKPLAEIVFTDTFGKSAPDITT
jgi:nitroreductase